MHNSKAALTQKAVEIARKKHPKGFNKAELIKCSKEVNAGFSTNPFKKIKTMEDVGNMANHMSDVDGGYPRGMTGCFVVGINGGCGIECPVFLQGNCEELGDHLEDLETSDIFTDIEKAEIKDMYV